MKQSPTGNCCETMRPFSFQKFLRLSATLFALLTVFVAGSFNKAVAAPQESNFEGAKWIWHREAGQAAGTWYFQKGFAFPAGQKPKKAHVIITCDNEWVLSVNGKQAGRSDSAPNSWMRPQRVEVATHLVIEKNAIAVESRNTIPGPAGLLLKLVVEFEGKTTFEQVSDASWVSTAKPEKGWQENGFVPGPDWTAAEVIGDYGVGPWGKPTVGGARPGRAPVTPPMPVLEAGDEEFEKPVYRDGAVFVGRDCGLNPNRQQIYVQNVRGTRAYTEMDMMTPAALGRELWSLIPLGPEGRKTLLCDAGTGSIGSPSVSYDGKTVYFTMVKEGEAYFHIYRIDLTGTGEKAPGKAGSAVQLTNGPFHDYDPVELPDGRIVFSSTRLGSREEYHAKYASSLFTCNPAGKHIRPLTYHIVADREPRVMADGSLIFVRADNFLERAKVEIHLHQTRIDGMAGQVIIGPGRKGVRLDRDTAAEQNMNWLRRYGMGSPAPLPDGRVAAISQLGLVTSASPTGQRFGNGFLPFDLSPLPDGRLLCSSKGKDRIIVFNPATNRQLPVFAMPGIHSVVHLGKRKKPSMTPSMVDPQAERRIDKTGFLYCQNVLNTQHTTTDTGRIKAVRVYEGRPFTLEPTKSIYEHIGTIGVELGTVPLAKDGSFYAEVPADRPLALQAVDGEGRAVINELSWIYTRPGEQRACVGCHAPVDAAPTMTATKALQSRPLKLVGQGMPHRFRANNGANGGIANLQMDKFREVTAINLHNVPGDDDLSTVRRLGILRERSAVPILLKALADERPEMRCAAALSLSACGNRNAVEPLMTLLEDDNATVVRAAENALSHLTGAPQGGTDWEAIEGALVKKILTPAQLASVAADTPTAGDRASGAVATRPEVHMAIEALGHVGGDRSRKALRLWLRSHPDGELRMMMAAMRSLGYLQDREALADLKTIADTNLNKRGKGGWNEGGANQKPVYLTATAIEALGLIGGADAERTVLDLLPKLGIFHKHVFSTGDHEWLMSAQPSPIYFRALEALDRMACTAAGPAVPKLIESLPSDKDRGLLYELDSYEQLVGRVIARSGRTTEVVEACLAVLGEVPVSTAGAGVSPQLKAAVPLAPHNKKHIRKHSAQARAAQVLSVVCMDAGFAERIRTVLLAYRAQKPSETRSWVCFMLTRTLGRLGDDGSIDLFVEMLEKDPTETALGLNLPPHHLVYKGWRPFYRPAAAWALGELQAGKAIPALLKVVQDLDNASSTREQAAAALGKVGDRTVLPQLRALAEEYPEIMTRRALLTSAAQLASKEK